MKALIVLLLAAASALLAQDHESKFTVQRIPPAQVEDLAQAEAKVESAVKSFREAQDVLKRATADRDELAKKIKAAANPFEADCGYPQGLYYSGSSFGGTRKYRRVEIRGEYLLVSDGEGPCQTLLNGTFTFPNSGPAN
jgi:hypothetical protein